MLRGHLRTIVLKALAEEPQTGYSLMKYVEHHTQVKPSTGSIYPLLDALRKKKFVSVKEDQHRKRYTLTKQGREEYKRTEATRDAIIARFLEGLNMIESLFEEDFSLHRIALESLKRGEHPFKELNPEHDRFKSALCRALKDPDKNQRAKIRTILGDAARRLKAV